MRFLEVVGAFGCEVKFWSRVWGAVVEATVDEHLGTPEPAL